MDPTCDFQSSMDAKLNLLHATNSKVCMLPHNVAQHDIKYSSKVLDPGLSCSDHSPRGSKSRKLEELAESLQRRLYEKRLVQDRRVNFLQTRMVAGVPNLVPIGVPNLLPKSISTIPNLMTKTIPKSFLGSDAVSVLQDLLREQQPSGRIQPPIHVSREDAIKAGNKIIKHLHFFCHATNHCKLTLEDSPQEIFRFDHNLPTAVRRMKRLVPTYWDKVKILEQNVQVKDHWHVLQCFSESFMGSEAIDALMELKLVKSRSEGVRLIRKLNQKVHCCDHVTNELDFRDDHHLYQFIPDKERMPEPLNRNKCRLPARSRTFDGTAPYAPIGNVASPNQADTGSPKTYLPNVNPALEFKRQLSNLKLSSKAIGASMKRGVKQSLGIRPALGAAA